MTASSMGLEMILWGSFVDLSARSSAYFGKLVGQASSFLYSGSLGKFVLNLFSGCIKRLCQKCIVFVMLQVLWNVHFILNYIYSSFFVFSAYPCVMLSHYINFVYLNNSEILDMFKKWNCFFLLDFMSPTQPLQHQVHLQIFTILKILYIWTVLFCPWGYLFMAANNNSRHKEMSFLF